MLVAAVQPTLEALAAQIAHLEQLTLAREAAISERISGMSAVAELRSTTRDMAIEKAEQATERRFDAMNEFRQALSDQTGQFVTRAVLDARLAALELLPARIASIEAKLYLGGTGFLVVVTLIQLGLNLLHK